MDFVYGGDMYPDLPEIHTVIIEPGITHILTETLFDFRGTTEFTEVIIPDTVVSIGDYAFYGCENLTTIVIPDSVKTIGNQAFADCDKLTSINIPKSVENIAGDAFRYSDNLAGIWVDEENAYYSSDAAGVFYNKDKTSLLMIPAAYEGEYIIPEGVQKIADSAVYENDKITKIVIPASVVEIGLAQFYGCDNLETVIYCGTEEQWNAIDAKDVLINQLQYHMYGDWTVVDHPSCEEEGLKQRECVYCNHVETQSIEVLDHTPGAAADCENDQTCTVCGDVLVEKLGHTPGAAADCENDQTCTVCDKVLAEKLGHKAGTPVIENKTDPSYTAAGSYDEVTCCAVCGTELSRVHHIVDKLNIDVINNGVNVEVDGNIVTVNSAWACRVAYWDAETQRYVTLSGTMIDKDSYSFAAPDGVTELVVVVIGDMDQDGDLDATDNQKLAAALLAGEELENDPLMLLVMDVNGNGKINSADRTLIARALLATSHNAYKELAWNLQAQQP